MERLALDPDHGTGWIGAGSEQLVANDGSEHGHLAGARHLLLAEETAELERPGADGRQIRAGALHLRAPVGVSAQDLGARVHAGREIAHTGNVGPDRRRIIGRQRRDGALACTHRTEGAGSGVHHDDVRAGTSNLVLDRGAGPGANGDHDDDGGNADDHPQRGQRRPHRVAPKCPHGHGKRHQQGHNILDS